MSFNPNIPQTTDAILQSFSQLRANFQAIDAAFSNNHASMSGDLDLAGKHAALTMRPQSGNPVTSANETAIFTKIVSSAPCLFFAPNNSQTPIQLTHSILSAGSGLTQQSFIAGPFIVYGGVITKPSQGQAVTLTPGSSLIFIDLIIGQYNKPVGPSIVSATPTSVSGTSFNITLSPTVISSGANYNVYYFAIGLP